MAGGRIDFYILNTPTSRSAQWLACKVTEKAWKSGLPVALCVDEQDTARAMDDLLWTYSQSSFLPHSLAATNTDDPVRIHAGLPEQPLTPETIMVCMLREPVPESHLDFRIADIIGDSEQQRAEARRRFKYYRERGCSPSTHKI